jgi:murein DD-endopeptidase MepM/ murein hydrolase activator NlpD
MRAHKGIDLSAPVGTPIYATADGVVGKAAWFGGYGLYVQLEHGNDLETRYGHMSRLNVAEGQTVHKGDILGYVGTTGNSTGPHLHYEVRVDGVAVNPVPYMQSDRVALAAKGN